MTAAKPVSPTDSCPDDNRSGRARWPAQLVPVQPHRRQATRGIQVAIARNRNALPTSVSGATLCKCLRTIRSCLSLGQRAASKHCAQRQQRRMAFEVDNPFRGTHRLKLVQVAK